VTYDFDTLAGRFLANFWSIRFPRCEPVWAFEGWDMDADGHARCLEHALRCEELLVRCHRLNLRQALHGQGCSTFLDRVEGIIGDRWRIHLFLADEAVGQMLPALTVGEVGTGDPSTFDPRQFVERRIERVKNTHRLTGRYEWLGDDLP